MAMIYIFFDFDWTNQIHIKLRILNTFYQVGILAVQLRLNCWDRTTIGNPSLNKSPYVIQNIQMNQCYVAMVWQRSNEKIKIIVM
jgi:hypothetical protein